MKHLRALIDRRQRARKLLALAVSLLSVCTAVLAEPERTATSANKSTREFSASRFLTYVETLASDAYEGRSLGSEGADKAANFIESKFRDVGLEPPPGMGYRQQFPVHLNLKLVAGRDRNELRIAGPASLAQFDLHKDYLPLPFSANGRVRDAEMVFAGYAIHAPELEYDDFADLDVRGKVVIALRREPQESQQDSRFAGRDFTEHATFAAKARNVAKRGGKALLIVSNRLPTEQDMELPAFPTSTGPTGMPIPVLIARPTSLAPFFTEQGVSLNALVRRIDESGKPVSLTFPRHYRVSLAVKVDSTSAQGTNVLGWVPGDDDSQEYIVVGAHFDHVGRGENFSMDNRGKGKIHPGADDNASGVAALLELARQVVRDRGSANDPKHKQRSVLFVAFSGEEHGLFGSAYFLHHARLNGKHLVGMLNFDMVGRLRNDELFTAGLDSIPKLADLATESASSVGLSVKPLNEYPYNMSDHGTFLDAGIPAVLLFTGLHMEYHTPRDTADRVDSVAAMKVLHVADALLAAMRDSSTELHYVGGTNPGYERNLREVFVPPNPHEFE